MSDIPKVFEVVDATSDEVYHCLGFYLDFDSAEQAVRSQDKPDCWITDSGGYENFERVEIRAHAVGWGFVQKPVMVLERSKELDDESDEYKWTSEYKFYGEYSKGENNAATTV